MLLKTVQRLGYFIKMADVPPPIVAHLVEAIGGRPITQQALHRIEQSGGHQRLLNIVVMRGHSLPAASK